MKETRLAKIDSPPPPGLPVMPGSGPVVELPRTPRPALVPILQGLLEDSSRDLRQAAAEALAQAGDLKAAELLVPRLQDSDEGVRRAAALSLSALGWKAPDRKSLARHAVILERWDQVQALGRDAMEALTGCLRSRESGTRVAAAQCLGGMGLTEAVPHLARNLDDPNAAVRRASAHALSALKWVPREEGHKAQMAVELENWSACEELGPVSVTYLTLALRENLLSADKARSITATLLHLFQKRLPQITEAQLQLIADMEFEQQAADGWSVQENSAVGEVMHLRETAMLELVRRGDSQPAESKR